MKAFGATAVGGFAATRVTNARAAMPAGIEVSQENGYEVWTVTSKEVYDLSDGETLENVLVDQTAGGAMLNIRSQNASGWTVRNVGFKGVGQDGDGSHSYQFQVSTPSGSSGHIENIWASGKARNGQSASSLGGIYIRASHAGQIDIRNTYIEGFGNNAVYGSGVGKDGNNNGTVTIKNAYHRDNTVSQFRIGSPGSWVRNSVGVVNDPEGARGDYPYDDGNRTARGVWGKHFEGQLVENCSFYISPDDTHPAEAFAARYISGRSNGPRAELIIRDCDLNSDAPQVQSETDNAEVVIDGLGENPTVDVIGDGGVPTSPEMAANGNREMPPELPGADGGDGDEEYDVMEVSGNEVYDLEDGETFENVLVDQTADGASLTIRSQNASNWEVRNVGFRGVGQRGESGEHHYQFQVSTPDGGTGRIENVWANGKERDGQPASSLGGIYIRASHAGQIDIRNTYIEGFGNNAVFASAVGKDNGNDGSVSLKNCYHRDNTVSQFGIGAPGSSVQNCVGVVNDPEGARGDYPYAEGNRTGRGIWAKHFPDQRVENCAFYVSPDDTHPAEAFGARYISDRSHGDRAELVVNNCDLNPDAPTRTKTSDNAEVSISGLGDNPSVDVIGNGGVPTSPEMAASGNREMPPELPESGGGGDDYEVMTVEGKEVYDLSDGEVFENVLVDQTADGAMLNIRSQNASGWTVRNVGFLGVGQDGDGSHSYQFQVSTPSGGTGRIENVWANGKARNGQSGSELGGIYIRASHAGQIDIRHTYIEGFGNNAVYASGVGKDGNNNGTVTIKNAYHRDNTVSQFRIGSPGSWVRNSVGIVNDPDGDRGDYPYDEGNHNARGVWGKHFENQLVENCSFYISPNDTNPAEAFAARYIGGRSNGPRAELIIRNCDLNSDAPQTQSETDNAEVVLDGLGENPSVDVIGGGGVPTSPRMAARGNREMPPELP